MSRFSPVDRQSKTLATTAKGDCLSGGKRATSVVALAGNFDFPGSSFLTRLTAVLVAILSHAPAWQVCALLLFVGRHHHFSLSRLFHRVLPPDAAGQSYFRFIIQPMNVPAVTPIANVAARVNRGCRCTR
jgi:hypothetical protein